MNRLTYEIYNGSLYLTDFFADATPECEISVKGCGNAGFSIGTECFRLTLGVGRVKLSAIKKGNYIPKLILDEQILCGGLLHIGAGAEAISAVADIAQRERRELLLSRRLDDAEKEISRLKDSVYGTTIF